MKNNKKGFTIVELLVTSTLLLMFSALAYQVFGHLWGTYQRTEKKWLTESDVKQTMARINNAIDLSYQVALDEKANIASVEADEEPAKRYFYYDAAQQNIYFIDYDSDTSTHLAPVQINELPVTATFTNIDETNTARKDMLYLTINSAGGESNYSLSTAIYLSNVSDSVAVADGATDINLITFNVAKDGIININEADLPDACFVATAAYGDFDNDNVRLLRIFRDEVLAKSGAGRKFISWYYDNSPYWASIISQNSVLRFISRLALTPLIGFAVLCVHPVFALAFLTFSIGIAAAIKKRKTLSEKN